MSVHKRRLKEHPRDDQPPPSDRCIASNTGVRPPLFAPPTHLGVRLEAAKGRQVHIARQEAHTHQVAR